MELSSSLSEIPEGSLNDDDELFENAMPKIVSKTKEKTPIKASKKEQKPKEKVLEKSPSIGKKKRSRTDFEESELPVTEKKSPKDVNRRRKKEDEFVFEEEEEEKEKKNLKLKKGTKPQKKKKRLFLEPEKVVNLVKIWIIPN